MIALQPCFARPLMEFLGFLRMLLFPPRNPLFQPATALWKEVVSEHARSTKSEALLDGWNFVALSVHLARFLNQLYGIFSMIILRRDGFFRRRCLPGFGDFFGHLA